MLLQKIPFLRLLIPFVSGILTEILVYSGIFSPGFAFITAIILLLFYFLKRKYTNLKFYFIVIADIFLFTTGNGLTYYSRTNLHAAHYTHFVNVDSNARFIAVINNIPVTSEKWIKCNMKVIAVKKNKSYTFTEGQIIAYFKNPLKERLHPGQSFYLNAKFVEVGEPLNPDEFDYKSYLNNRQVFHTVFIDSSSFQLIENTGRFLNPVWLYGLKLKEKLLSSLQTSGLNPEAIGICEALLTGYDDDIENDVLTSFSHTGTLHVLSVSGLHTGLIYLVLSFLFDLADRNRRYKLLKLGFITCFLWLFALITGFSAPVLRAVLMFNLLGLGNIYFRIDKYNQVNILLFSAFILLSYNPFFICDVGFLLSYFALGGLIVFVPFFETMLQPTNPVVKYLWQSVAASFSATISTLPFTLYYFKQFPVWFFVCNIVVVPATFVLLILSLLVVLKVFKAVLVTNVLVKLLIAFINLFNNPFGYAEGIDFTLTDAVMLTVLILMVCTVFYYRSYRLTVVSVIILILWQANNIIYAINRKEHSELVVYHIKKKSTCSVKNSQLVYLSYYDPQKFNFHVYPHLVSYNYPTPVIAPFNYVQFGRHGIMFLNTPKNWPEQRLNETVTLVVSNNFRLKETDLKRFTHLKTIVADGSNNNYRIEELAKLSSKFGIDFYSTRLSGAYIFSINETQNWR